MADSSSAAPMPNQDSGPLSVSARVGESSVSLAVVRELIKEALAEERGSRDLPLESGMS